MSTSYSMPGGVLLDQRVLQRQPRPPQHRPRGRARDPRHELQDTLALPYFLGTLFLFLFFLFPFGSRSRRAEEASLRG